jgi:imidazole glycerol-phosphate synthase subunit HisH
VIALVDYGAGNLTSVKKALAALDADVTVPRAADELGSASGIIVPGVGHFDRTRAIDREWREAIQAAVEGGVALFGICLGMQWLFEGSDEAPDLPGLGVFRGVCEKLSPTSRTRPTSPNLKVPHVGWNSLDMPLPTDLMHDVERGAQVYFTHSFAAPVVPQSAATTTYGVTFTAAVQHGRVAGVQFHPEKSGDVGLQILRNWLVAASRMS